MTTGDFVYDLLYGKIGILIEHLLEEDDTVEGWWVLSYEDGTSGVAKESHLRRTDDIKG